jgi:hypothetical protein
MLQYRLQPIGNYRCDYATGVDFCDAFVTSTDSLYLLALLLTANHEAAERCFVAALDQAFKANATCDVGTPTIWAARYLKDEWQTATTRLLQSRLHGECASASDWGAG